MVNDKNKLKMKAYIKHIILLLFSCLFVFMGHAQVIHITGNVSKMMRTLDGKGNAKEPLSTPYIFDNGRLGRKQTYNTKGRRLGSVVNIKGNDVITPDYMGGHFEADVSANGALLVTNGAQVKVIEIKGTQLNYDITFASGTDAILLQGTSVYAKRKGVNFIEQPPLDDGQISIGMYRLDCLKTMQQSTHD